VTDLCATDAVTLAAMLRRRDVSAREVTAAHVQRIEDVGGVVNAVVTRTFDAALDQAARADEALARGAEPGPLHGLPVAHKDLHDTAGVRTTYGSVLFADHVPDRDALVVQRMSQAGAISLGTTQHPGVRGGLAHGQPGVRRHPQPLRPEPERRREQRGCGGGAGRPDDQPGGRQ
jgi:amidase